MSKLYGLLVGINEYHPDSPVGSLKGCLNDIQNVEFFLKKHYKKVLSPSIKRLENSKATRENIIKTFQSHLIKKAKENDTVLFYFSGHGSFSKTAKEFKQFDSKAQDESLVCYDSRLDGKFDIADKELAVLLSRINQKAHIIVIVDSCHSGSITRSVVNEMNLGKKRYTGKRQNEKPRPIGSYLLDGDNYYQDLIDAGKGISIPNCKHIVISACERDQEASETLEDEGLFSSILMEKLKLNRNLTYSDLFAKVRHSIAMECEDQTPTFQSLNGFNPNTIFLLNEIKTNTNRHPIIFHEEDKSWRLQYGAIHGLPTDNNFKKLKIGIYPDTTAKNSEKLIKQVEVKKVLLKETILKFKDKHTQSSFMGEIQSMPTSLLVRLDGSETNINAFEKKYNKAPSAFLTLDRTAEKAKYTLSIEKTKLVIRLTADMDNFIHGVKKIGQPQVEHIVRTLENIEEWERIINLENEKSKIKRDIDLVFRDESKGKKPIDCEGDIITFDYPPIGKDRDKDGNLFNIWYAIKAKNKGKRNLNIALLHLGEDYSVTSMNSSQIKAQSKWITLTNDYQLEIKSEKKSEETDVFKLIVSTEPFDDYPFLKEPIENEIIDLKITRGSSKRAIGLRKKSEDDWCVKTIVVNTIRKEDSIQNKDVDFKDEKITFIGHKKFKANIAFAPVNKATKSVHSVAKLSKIYRGKGLELLYLSSKKTRSINENAIIELSGIENVNSLKKDPLTLKVNHQVEKDEQIISVTLQNGYVIPLGHSLKEKDGSTTIKFETLPTSVDRRNRAKKNVKRAIWFSLIKVAGFRHNAFLLRIARLNKKGKLDRSKKSIKLAVKNSKSILLVIHGIIGDTNVQAMELMPYVKNGTYDTILTFDYENLNEGIANIAKELNLQLEGLELGKNDGKKLDIVAHSMGGLVSRWMIENIRKGDNMVDRLFMFGTPNGGSPFGDIPSYIDLFTKLVSVGLNFGKAFLPGIIAYLKTIEKANRIFIVARNHLMVTLDEMNSNSSIINQLKENKKIKINTQYYAIAGDILLYTQQNKTEQSAEERELSFFLEKVLFKIGKKANLNQPNDIAVGVKEIHQIPASFKPKKFKVKGYHMNYFINKEAMKIFDDIIKGSKK